MSLPDITGEKKDPMPGRRGIFSTFLAALKKPWIHIVLLVGLGFLVRMPALQGQFIWDDDYLAEDNPLIKSPLLILETFRHHLFLDSHSAHYRPVQNISLIWDYFFWNTNPYGFHLTNILLHVTAGVLVYLLLSKLLVAFWQSSRKSVSQWAFITALLWVVHPVHSAAVDYISGRADSLAFVFACAGWLLFLVGRGLQKSARRYACYGSACVCGLLSLCSRESALLWVALFLFHLLVFDKSASRRLKLISLVCCLVLVSAYASLRHLPEAREGSSSFASWSPASRAVLMWRSLGDYGRLMVFPSNLHMERTIVDPDNYLSTRSWLQSADWEYLSITGLLVFALLLTACLWKGEGQAARIFAVGWFFIGYLPISNLIDLNATAAEHWLYLPSVGLLLLIVGCVRALPRSYRKVSVTFAAAAVICFSARSVVRSTDWLTNETFYTRTYTAGGTSIRVALNLGQIFACRQDYARAEQIFRRILVLSPADNLAQVDLADAIYHQGRVKEAQELYASAAASADQIREEYPRTWIAAVNLARLQHNDKNDTGALAILQRAHAEYPRIWEVTRFEAELVRLNSGPKAALCLVEQFAHLNWWHHGAQVALGQLYAEEGDAARAEIAFHNASRLDVHDVEALDLMAMMRVRQNHLEDACDAQRRAVARQPDQPRQYIMLSNILAKMGETNQAKLAIAQATRLQALAGGQPITN